MNDDYPPQPPSEEPIVFDEWISMSTNIPREAESTTINNVSSINSGKASNKTKKKRKKRTKVVGGYDTGSYEPPKPKDFDVVQGLRKLLEHADLSKENAPLCYLSEMPEMYKAYRNTEETTPTYARVVNRTAIAVSPASIVANLTRFIAESGEAICGMYGKKLANASAAVSQFGNASMEKEPYYWGHLLEEEIIFNRLGYTPTACDWGTIEQELPVVADIIGRIEGDSATLLQWIGSVLVKESDRRQVVWLHGAPQAGKTLLAKIIAELLAPPIVVRLEDRVLMGDFLAVSLVKKRLAIVNDAVPGFLNTSVFKRLTGEREQMINPKHQAAYETTIDTKFIFVSNQQLSLKREAGAMDRILVYSIKEREEGARRVQPETLIPQMKSKLHLFAGYCIDAYKKATTDNGGIKATTNELEQVVAAGEEEFSTVLEDNFHHGQEHVITNKELKEVLTQAGLLGFKRQKDFTDFAMRRPHITAARWQVKGTRSRGYRGIGKL